MKKTGFVLIGVILIFGFVLMACPTEGGGGGGGSADNDPALVGIWDLENGEGYYITFTSDTMIVKNDIDSSKYTTANNNKLTFGDWGGFSGSYTITGSGTGATLKIEDFPTQMSSFNGTYIKR